MTTSPPLRPDLAPTAGATSPGDLAPRPPLLRRGAKSRGDLDTTHNHNTTSPQGRSRFLWPCDRRDAHGPHLVSARLSPGDDEEQVYEPCEEFDCPGVRTHPATMIGRPS